MRPAGHMFLVPFARFARAVFAEDNKSRTSEDVRQNTLAFSSKQK